MENRYIRLRIEVRRSVKGRKIVFAIEDGIFREKKSEGFYIEFGNFIFRL